VDSARAMDRPLLGSVLPRITCRSQPYVRMETTPWRREVVTRSGKVTALPRLTAWYGDRGHHFAESDIDLRPRPRTADMRTIKNRIEPLLGVVFDSVLLNLYRDGNDGVAWHSDDDAEIGPRPLIASSALARRAGSSCVGRRGPGPGRAPVAMSACPCRTARCS
jgi:2OG-Fe(II) oxygenase superfamily